MSDYSHLILWLGVVSVLTFIISLASLPWLVSQIPADYFLHKYRAPAPWKKAHPIARIILMILKNSLGFVLLIGGFIMLFIPGQGLLTMAMGLLLMDYPGKYQLEQRLVGRQSILKSLNWLRAKRNIDPLQFVKKPKKPAE